MTTINLRQAPAAPRQLATRTIRERVTTAELFPEERTITCAVCDTRTLVTRGLDLCDACIEDLDASATRVANVYATAIFRYQRAWVLLWQAAEASSEKAWWDQVWAYKSGPSFDAAAYARAWDAAKRAGGERARLCGLWEDLDACAEVLEIAAPRHARASEELRAARDLAGWPVEV